MKYDVVVYPDERLKLVSSPVEKIDEELIDLINEMFRVMYESDGCGLAGVQIGILQRLFVMEIKGKKYVMINPEILERSRDYSFQEEGCLSLPGIGAEVKRSKRVTVKYTDIDGKEKILKAAGLLAVCIQHEYDHLDGKVFIDHLPPDEKLSVLKNYRKQHNL
ncbi:MAG: peptide deformylase [Spirochaetales bacterium]|nr:peptide deformylase [Spirochaetales bacterium]MBQ2295371.1 peptide deformylase [Spirochaetales bacterium]